MTKFLKVALVSAFIVTGLSAADSFLIKATNGALNGNEFGITKLDDSVMKNIKGGYVVVDRIINDTFAVAIAIPHPMDELGVVYGPDGVMDYDKTMAAERGLCPMGVTECFSDKDKRTHFYQNKVRLLDYAQALGDYKPATHALTYVVQKNTGITNRGQRYTYFTYGVAAYNYDNGTLHSINSSLILNNNSIIRELRDGYKERFERSLGGLNP